MAAHRRHDISDRAWANIEKLLPGSKGCVGRPSADNRLFINAAFRILRTGAPWLDLPPRPWRPAKYKPPLSAFAGSGGLGD